MSFADSQSFGSLFAQIVETPPRFDFMRLAGYSENWQYAVLGIICAVVFGLVFYMYRRDSVELKPGIGVVLLLLRLAAFAGLLLQYLDLQKRSDRIKTDNSEVVIAVDVTTSMDRKDGDGIGSSPLGPSRISTVVDAFKLGELVEKLRKNHDVVVYRFDSDAQRIVGMQKFGTIAEDDALKTADDKTADAAKTPADDATTDTKLPTAALSGDPKTWNWAELLAAKGTESRYGQTLRQILFEERSHPLSRLIMIGDFAHNAGLSPEEGIKAANEARVPVHAVAVGSTKIPVNASISDFRAPPRVYPDDKFQITATIQASGVKGNNADIKLYVKETESGNRDDGTPGELVMNETIILKNNEDVVFAYESPGVSKAGKRTYTLVVDGLKDDVNPADNRARMDVEIVERKNRVLLLAGGPTREYQFLRNQLRRDKYTEVDVILQNAEPGISQDAHAILDEFPRTLKALTGTKDQDGNDVGGYDAIVAFDPDWRRLDAEQIDVLDQWLARESGGLVVVAGPVYMDGWLEDNDEKLKKVRGFYPVQFDRRLLAIDNSKFVNEIAWPMEFTPEGASADFLWLGSTADESRQSWDEFSGIYGFYQVSKSKPGAIVYGHFSNPDVSLTGKPIYLAEQFWGGGRVFYMGSGEMWRLRELGDGYFEQFYTKLIRHVSQGRLLRGSKLGSLLLDRDRYIQGSTIPIRAQLQNLQQQPLEAPDVTVELIAPNGGAPKRVILKADPVRKGFFVGQYMANQVGSYELRLVHPEDSTSTEAITKRLQVAAPQLEVDHPTRDDALGRRIAEATTGEFFIGLPALTTAIEDPVVSEKLFPDQKKEKREATTIDREWQEQYSQWLLFGIVGCLCLEWLIRRLCRLA